MGHCISYLSFDEKVARDKTAKKDMLSDLYDWIYYNKDLQEGDAYVPDVAFDSHPVFENREKARDYLENVCDDYEFRAVRYHSTETLPETAKMKEICKQMEELEKQRKKFFGESLPAKLKSKLITCKRCGSHINFHFYENEERYRCPVCGEDMRSPTTISRMEGYAKKRHALEVRYLAERDKASGKAPVRWLVHCECHC